MHTSINTKTLSGDQSPQDAITNPLMRVEAIKRAASVEIARIVTKSGNDVRTVLVQSGQFSPKYVEVEVTAFRWRLARQFRKYFQP